MQAYVASDDPEICAVVRGGLRRPRRVRAAGLGRRLAGTIWHFFATGMMLNVLASMQVTRIPSPGRRTLLEGCGKDI